MSQCYTNNRLYLLGPIADGPPLGPRCCSILGLTVLFPISPRDALWKKHVQKFLPFLSLSLPLLVPSLKSIELLKLRINSLLFLSSSKRRKFRLHNPILFIPTRSDHKSPNEAVGAVIAFETMLIAHLAPSDQFAHPLESAVREGAQAQIL